VLNHTLLRTYVNTSLKPEANANSFDDRMITANQLRTKVCENNILSPQQQKELYQADGSRSHQGAAYARTVAEISWVKLHNELRPQQRISASAAKQRISEMDRLSLPE